MIRGEKKFSHLDTLETLKIEIINLKDEYVQLLNGLDNVLSQNLNDTSNDISNLIYN